MQVGLFIFLFLLALRCPAAPDSAPLRMLVLSCLHGGSNLYPDFDYLARQTGAEMVYWHTYPREWDVYHLMDSLLKHEWRAAAKPLNARAQDRLRELLAGDWDLIAWTFGDLPPWARAVLAGRVRANRPVIFFGEPPAPEKADEMSKLFAACRPVPLTGLGATGRTYAFALSDKLRALPAPARLLIFPHAAPFPESGAPATDEVASLADFWREVVAHLVGKPPLPLASVAAMPVSPLPVTLGLTPDRMGAEYGESIKLKVNSEPPPATVAGPFTIQLAVADRTGRALWQEQRVAPTGAVAETFAYALPNLGVETYAYYVTAWLLAKGEPVGCATTTVYHYRPWDMHRQWQWSPWEDLYRWPSYRAAAAMNLFADAGLNSVGTGYATPRALWWAERYGWRKYAELQGGKKLWNGPVIETADDAVLRQRVRQQMAQMHKYFGNAWPSAALTLGSLGEEPGFSESWGGTYYWKKDVAPPVAQTVFQQFLKERYATVAELAESWQTPVADWPAALLLKKYSLEGQKFDPTELIEDAPEDARDQARYVDSTDFFAWYFRKVARLATETAREINPAIRTFYSLHGPDFDGAVGVAGMHHLYYPKEYQAIGAARARMRTGGEPCFSLIWNHFDEPGIVEAGLWSQVANQVTHVNVWLGFPLLFNNDLTHTRASLATKRFLARFQPVSDLLARATIPASGAALLATPSLDRPMAHRNLQSAFTMLAESGFPPAFADETQLAGVRLLFATAVTQLGARQVVPLRRYVEAGGVLIATAGFATRAERGRLFERPPGEGWAAWLGFRYGAALEREGSRGRDKITVKDGGPFQFGDIKMASTPFAVALLDLAPDVEVLARLADGTPAVLHRKIGRGHLYHFNFLHREWGWGMAVKPDREPARRLVAEIARRHAIVPRFYIESCAAGATAGDGLPYWGSQLFVGADGRTQYLVVFNDHRAPLITGRIHWYAPGWRGRDLLAGNDLAWTGRDQRGDYLDLALAPGQGAVLQLVPPGQAPEKAPAAAPAGPAIALPRNLQPVVPHGWPSEKWPERTLSDANLAATLDRLREVYQGGTNRLALSYFLFDANSENRHALARTLAEQHWPDRLAALESALRGGARWLLTGEDLSLDPATGLTVTTRQPAVIAALAQLGQRQDARWFAGTDDGQTLVLTLGKGRLALDRTSLDSVGFYDREYAAWHKLWWPVMARLLDEPVSSDPPRKLPALAEAQLAGWLTGRWLPLAEPRVSHFADHGDRALLKLPARSPPAPPLAFLALPPGCRVARAAITVTVAGEVAGNLRLGIGGEVGPGLPVAVATAGAPVVVSAGLAELINAWLPRAPRDNNGLAIVPLHVELDGGGEVTLSEPRIVLSEQTDARTAVIERR